MGKQVLTLKKVEAVRQELETLLETRRPNITIQAEVHPEPTPSADAPTLL